MIYKYSAAPRLRLSESFMFILAVSCLASCGNGGGSVSIISSTNIVLPSSIATVANSWASTPLPDTANGMTGTVTHFCDCGSGASGSCVAGNDSTGTGTAENPYQSIAKAVSTLNAASRGDTVALCKGGAFNVVSGFNINTSCTAGSSCFDFREYSPTTFSATAKPIINNAAGAVTLFTIKNGFGGVRFLNLSLNGDNTNPGNLGFFIYNGGHDVTMGNLTMNSFPMAADNESGSGSSAVNNNITFTGNTVTNSSVIGYLGGGNNNIVSYNYFHGNGGNSNRDHTIYIGTHVPVSNVQVVGNYIHGQFSPTCVGSPIVAHSIISGLSVSYNYITIDDALVTAGCWGIQLDNGSYTEGITFTNAVVSGNTIVNGGNANIAIGQCVSCTISNNLLINNTSIAARGIYVPDGPARTSPADGVNTGTVIENNTIYFAPSSSGAFTGITVGVEGTKYVVSNNAIYSAQSSGSLTCFNYGLALSAYAFSNNNLCYKTSGTPIWEATTGDSLAEWSSYSGFDTKSIVGIDPLFTNAPTDFTPATGSPLIGAGNSTYAPPIDILGNARTPPITIGAYQ